MPSQIAWLDASAAEQRRMREIINLFTERASLDDLGLGQVRDAVADGLFPGTSTLLTRARYALFIPWCYQEAAHHRNVAARPAQADRLERDVIEALRGTGEGGLIGAQAGRAVKNLPSVLYWSFLRHYRILTDPTLDRPDAAERLARTTFGGAEVGVWTSSLPEAPAGFPQHVPGGFAMTRDEASWLQEQVLQSAPDTLFAHLVLDRPSADSSFPWEDPAALASRGLARELLRDAQQFSVVMHGAQLLYNLLLAEHYEQRGFRGISTSVESYRGALENWQQVELPSLDLDAWDVDGLLTQCDVIRGALVSPLARRFVHAWVELVRADPTDVAANSAARTLVTQRERQHKGAKSARLANDRRLQAWGGASGAGALAFRWPQVRQIVLDIHDGLESEDDHA